MAIFRMFFLIIVALMTSSGLAMAQSGCSKIAYDYVLTSGEWNNCFALKQDLLGYTALNKGGDVMLGKLVTNPSTTLQSGFSISPGAAPTSPNNGDIWTTTSGLFVRINGSTIGPLISFSGAFGVISPIELTSPGGVTTYGCSTCATGPASSTDRAIATYNGTGGKTLRNNATATIDASGNIGASGNITTSGQVSAATVAGSMIASKSQQQAATSTANVVTPSQQQSHPSAAKAWAFGTQTGTLTASYNFSSASCSSGNCSATFTTAFASATGYTCVGSSAPGGGSPSVLYFTTYATGSVSFNTVGITSGSGVTSNWSIACYGAQ